MLRSLIVLWFLFPATNFCYAQPVISITKHNETKNIAQQIQILTDTSWVLSFREIVSEEYKNKFVPVIREKINPSPRIFPIWCHFKLECHTSNKLVVAVNNARIADLYFINNNRIFHKTLSVYQPFHQRDILSNKPAFLLDIPKDSIQGYYLRLEMNSGTEFPVMIYTIIAWMENEHVTSILDGIYIGCMIIMILYNLFIFVSIRDISYLFYILYVTFMTLSNMNAKGLSFEFLWSNAPVLNHFVNIAACFTGIFALLFTASFLHISQYARFLRPFFWAIIGCYAITILFIIFQATFIGFILTEWVSIITAVALLAAGIIVYKKGYRPAKFYLAAWLSLLICIFIFVLKDYDILPYNEFTANSLAIGSAIEAILLSLALASRINDYKKEKEKAQLEALVSLEENRKLILKQNILLEKKVEERTSQLVSSNAELARSFQNLKETQSQLLKSEQEKLNANYHKELLELEAKSLRAQMNPHFIFNCLNSIKYLIREDQKDKSVEYLTTFSKLIRTLFNNADKKEITLYDEIETCKLYLQLEAMRFDDRFSYAVSVDESIDLKSVSVPALIIQPFIENAIWHGIMPKERGGRITLDIYKENGAVKIIIDDDGIGREASQQNKPGGIAHQSKGVNLTQSRLELDNLLKQRMATLTIIDKEKEKQGTTGTIVIITIDKEA